MTNKKLPVILFELIVYFLITALPVFAGHAFAADPVDLSRAEDRRVWKRVVEGLHAGQTISVEGRTYFLKKKLGDREDGNRVFLVQRTDASAPSKDDTILKINYHIDNSAKVFVLSNEKQVLDLQRQYIRTPNVHFLSSHGLVMEKEYIKGPRFRDWLNQGDSTEESLSRMFTLLRFIQKIRVLGLRFGDAHTGNIVFEEATGELVIFDPGSVDLEEPGYLYGLFHDYSIYSAITGASTHAYFTYWLAKYFFEKVGDNDQALKRATEVMESLGHDTPSVFRSLYGLNSFRDVYPTEFEYLLEVARGEFYSSLYDFVQKHLGVDGHIVPATRDFIFWLERELESSNSEQKAKLIRHVSRNELPGILDLRRKKLTSPLDIVMWKRKSRCAIMLFGESKYPPVAL